MKVTSISYQKTFNLGNYCSERIGVEIDIEEGDSLEEVFRNARESVEKEHRDNNPQLYGTQIGQLKTFNPFEGQSPSAVPHPNISETSIPAIHKAYQKKSTEESILEGIQSSYDIKILETYKLLSKNNPTLKEAYDKRLNELSK